MRLPTAALITMLAIGGLLPCEATAAPEDDARRLADYVRSPPVLKRLAVAKIMTDARLGRLCMGNERLAPIRLTGLDGPYEPFSFPAGAAHPSEGLFRVRFEVKDCLGPRTYNAVFVARSYAPPKMDHGDPGNTLADPIVAVDLKPMLIAQAALGVPKGANCRDVRVVDTAVSEAPRKESLSGGGEFEYWKETWDVSACGKGLPLSIAFTRHPARPGTTFEIKAIEDDRKIDAAPVPDREGDARLHSLLSSGYFNTDAGQKVAWGTVMESARNNSPVAQYTLALNCYKSRRCGPADALYWGLRAAYNGSAHAMMLLGAWYSDGVFVERDITRSVLWLKLAGAAGQSELSGQVLKLMAKQGQIDPTTHKEIIPVTTSPFDFFKGTDGETSSGAPAGQATGDSMR